MQNDDYAPNVSGYKVKFGKDFVEFHCGPQGPVRIGDLDKTLSPKTEPQTPAPSLFIVVGGVTLIREAEVERGTIAKPELAVYQPQVSADQFSADAESVADVVRKVLREELRPGGLLHRNA